MCHQLSAKIALSWCPETVRRRARPRRRCRDELDRFRQNWREDARVRENWKGRREVGWCRLKKKRSYDAVSLSCPAPCNKQSDFFKLVNRRNTNLTPKYFLRKLRLLYFRVVHTFLIHTWINEYFS